jgi:Tfp pilus assembly protein PilO
MPALPSLKALKLIDKKFVADVGIRYVVVLGLLGFGVLPSLRHWSSLHEKLRAERDQLIQAHAKLAQAAPLGDQRPGFMDFISKMQARFFTSDELPGLIAIVSDLARQHKLQMIASKPVQRTKSMFVPPPQPVMPPPPAGPPPQFYKSQDFEIEFAGGYHELGVFLSTLRKHPKLIEVQDLTIVTGESPTEHKIILAIAVYSKAEQT